MLLDIAEEASKQVYENTSYINNLKKSKKCPKYQSYNKGHLIKYTAYVVYSFVILYKTKMN